MDTPLKYHEQELSYAGIDLKGLIDSGKKVSAFAGMPMGLALCAQRSCWGHAWSRVGPECRDQTVLCHWCFRGVTLASNHSQALC
jgi:hypothetical protein